MPPRSLQNRTGSTWVETLDPGDYALTATVLDPPMVGTASAGVRRGQTTTVTITLRPGTTVAHAFVISFRFDSAFVEPCARPVLRQIAARAAANPEERMLIVGHTDKAGPPAYNQSLGERRARAVFAFLTFGRAAQPSVDEWTALRQRRPAGQTTTLADSWDVREYQQMLQDLGFYPGSIDGRDGPLTQEAVNAFRCSVGLPPGTMDDVAWERLIRRYMGQDNIGIPESKFFGNCPKEILKWVGCGEEAPLPTPQPPKGTAHRPYRRVEVLFVAASSLPCTIPEPDTFNLPAPGSVGSAWCVGPGVANRHCCFGTRACATAAPPHWCIQPAEPQTIQVTGRLRREVRAPNGALILEPDGSPKLPPVGGARFVMITPDGAFKRGEQTSGEPLHATTAANGSFTFPDVRIGTCHFEVADGGLARLATGTAQDAKGPSVCARLAAPADTLAAPTATLDVVLLAAPVLRQVRLPVVAHLMTALEPTTREVRTCPNPFNPTETIPQRTVKTEADVRALFDGANRIWEQARITFDVVGVVQETFAHQNRPACAVDGNEFAQILMGAEYPGVIDVYFFGTLEASGVAGLHTEVELQDAATGTVLDRAHAIAMGDTVLLRLFSSLPPVPTQMTAAGPAAVQVLAHLLGLYLTLDHVTPPNRLMLPNADPAHQLLVRDEVDQARASSDASDCASLSLTVTGAAAAGARSGLFVAPVAAAGIVTIDAQISPELLAAGTLTWTGGQPGANPLQQTVSAASPRLVQVRATYRPNSGGHEVTRFVRILVTGFRLNVTGATPTPPGGTTFRARRDPARSVTIDAVLDVLPETLTQELVVWTGGVENVDPLRRTVPQNVSRTVVTATVGGVTQSVTIIVFDLSVAPATAPFSPPLANVMIEGIANPDRRQVRQANLAAGQAPSLFRARADLPGIAGNTVPATLASVGPDGVAIETVNLVLTRAAPGSDTFVSLPLLAIPAVATRGGITFVAPQDMEVVLARAGGALTLRVSGMFAGQSAQATVRGRVVRLFIQGFAGSGITVADIDRHIARAASAWAQAGIEVRRRSMLVGVAPPAGLLDIDHTDDFGINLTLDERRLVGRAEPFPARSPVPTDVNVYYIRSLQGPPSGIAFPNTNVIALEGGVSDPSLAHEMGHHIITAWGGSEHQDRAGRDWPDTNILHGVGVATRRDLDRSQVANVVANTAAVRIIVIEPSAGFVTATPAATPVANAMIEGIPNPDRGQVSQANLAVGVAASLFRAQALFAGVAGNTMNATLTSLRADGTTVETLNLVLTRPLPALDTFLSQPVLAIPVAAGRAGLAFVAPQDMQVVLAEAGGTLVLRASGTVASETARLTVRGRVVRVFVQGFDCSGITEAAARSHIARANTAFAQAGIEVRERSIAVGVVPPDPGLCDVDSTDPEGENLTQDDRQMVGRAAPLPSPATSDVATDLNVYYVCSFDGSAAGIAYPNTTVIILEGPCASNTRAPGGVTVAALSHEIGHHLALNHKDRTGTDWPETHVMHPRDVATATDLGRTQVEDIVRNAGLGVLRPVVIVP
ncbi:MAG: OmpA family protein [Actinomycetota bacterium]|nr:OmpA family protein [Actinomycetota bacterium]